MVTNFPAASSLPLQVLVYIDAESRKKEAMYFFFFCKTPADSSVALKLTPKIYTSAMVLNHVPDNSCLGPNHGKITLCFKNFYTRSLFPPPPPLLDKVIFIS